MAHWRRGRIGDSEVRLTMLAVFGTPLLVAIIALVAAVLSLRNF